MPHSRKPMDLRTPQSSLIRRLRYKSMTVPAARRHYGILIVTLTSGAEWAYVVPRQLTGYIARAIRQGASPGAIYNRHIKGRVALRIDKGV